jgi:hypothetical protein
MAVVVLAFRFQCCTLLPKRRLDWTTPGAEVRRYVVRRRNGFGFQILYFSLYRSVTRNVVFSVSCYFKAVVRFWLLTRFKRLSASNEMIQGLLDDLSSGQHKFHAFHQRSLSSVLVAHHYLVSMYATNESSLPDSCFNEHDSLTEFKQRRRVVKWFRAPSERVLPFVLIAPGFDYVLY